jgi:hypothetical protein
MVSNAPLLDLERTQHHEGTVLARRPRPHLTTSPPPHSQPRTVEWWLGGGVEEWRTLR